MLVIASIPIFVLVVTVILYSVWQFRMRPGEELKDGPPIHGNTRLEVFWTALPAVLMLGLVSYSFVVLHDNEKKPAGREITDRRHRPAVLLDLPVPAVGDRRGPVNSYQLYLPEGESVYFKHALQGRHPRLLDPRLPPAGGRGARHHHPLPRDARPARQPTRSSATCSAGSGTR